MPGTASRASLPGAARARWLRPDPGGSAEGDSPPAASGMKCVLAIGCGDETKAASRRERWDLMAFLSLYRLEKLQGAQAASALGTTSWAFKVLKQRRNQTRGNLIQTKVHHSNWRSISTIVEQETNLTYLGIRIATVCAVKPEITSIFSIIKVYC